MPKVTENSENIDIDTNLDDSFDKHPLFASARARVRANGLIESSEEDSEADRDDAP